MTPDTTIDDSEWIDYTTAQLRDVIERAVAGTADGHQRNPRWFAVTGSHVYGFPSASSDLDVRGFHTVPADRYAMLDRPQNDEVTVNMDGTTDGFEDVAEIDLRSSELRHFGHLLRKANYNVMELVFCAPQVMNGVPLELDALRALLREHLPVNVPHSYVGMAKSNYYNYLDPAKTEAYDPRPKKYLYVYRGLLGAQYTHDEHAVEADVRALAEAVDWGDRAMVDELISLKRDADIETVGGDFEDTVRDEIAAAFNRVPDFGPVDKHDYVAALDDWMRKVRA